MRLAIVSAALLGAAAVPVSARPVAADHVRVELIAEDNAFVPGRRAWLGLRFVHEPHWHTYWINPGDSGLPTKLQWQLPEGYQAGAIDWPAPQRFESGGIVNFGYDGRALLLVPVDVPASARHGTVHVAVDAKWLVCREECIPGKATLKLALPVAKSAHAYPRWQRAFAAARARVPTPAAWTGTAAIDGERVRATLAGAGLPPPAGVDAFVVQTNVVGYARPRLHRDGRRLVVDFARSEYFSAAPPALDLVLVDGARARRVSIPFTAGGPPAGH